MGTYFIINIFSEELASKFKQFKSDEGFLPTAIKMIKWIGIFIVISYLIYGFVIQK